MKKILSLILSMSLLAGMGIGVRASNINEGTPEATKSVEARYQAGGESLTVVSVEIVWKGMSFTYTGASESQWDAEDHKYVSTEGYWEPSEASITITNHSNDVIQAEIEYGALDDFSETEMYFTDSTPVIGSAETSRTGSGEACSVTIEAIPGGTLSDAAQSLTSIGTITIRVDANLKSDPQIVAFDKIAEDYEKLINRGHDPKDMERGTVYFTSSEAANAVLDAMEELGSDICSTELELYERNLALNELITLYYGSLAMKQ